MVYTNPKSFLVILNALHPVTVLQVQHLLICLWVLNSATVCSLLVLGVIVCLPSHQDNRGSATQTDYAVFHALTEEVH